MNANNNGGNNNNANNNSVNNNNANNNAPENIIENEIQSYRLRRRDFPPMDDAQWNKLGNLVHLHYDAAGDEEREIIELEFKKMKMLFRLQDRIHLTLDQIKLIQKAFQTFCTNYASAQEHPEELAHFKRLIKALTTINQFPRNSLHKALLAAKLMDSLKRNTDDDDLYHHIYRLIYDDISLEKFKVISESDVIPVWYYLGGGGRRKTRKNRKQK